MLFSGILEFIIGNTFPFVVFMSFGAFWLTLGATLRPDFNAYGAYSPNPSSPAEGLTTVDFNASFGMPYIKLGEVVGIEITNGNIGFLLVFMGILSFVYFICALRTNIVYVVIFLSLVVGFALDAGQHFQIALGNIEVASGLQSVSFNFPAVSVVNLLTVVQAAGATFFVTSIAALWIFFSMMLEALDFPFKIPCGDISTLIKSNTLLVEERKAMEDMMYMEDLRHMADMRQMGDVRHML